jgi:3-oxoacyl-[acyl-carrier protein] reductase
MFEKPVMVITGTSRGIGQQLALHYATSGYQVVGCSRNNIEYSLDNYHHICADVSEESQLKGLFATVRKEYGRLDALINNAGLSSSTYAMLASADHIRSIYATNVIGTFVASREAVKLMKRSSFGRIINITSIHSPLATVGTSIYSSAKRSVEQYARVLAREVGSYGVTVNSVGLSYVQGSGMADETSSDSVMNISSQLALDIRINIKDVIYCLDIFLSTRAGTLTGQTLYTSGA